MSRLGADRLVGPIFTRGVWTARETEVFEFPVFEGGFAAVEAEFIVRLGCDADPDRTQWTAAEASSLVGALHVGVETGWQPAGHDQRARPARGDLGLRQQRRPDCRACHHKMG